MNKTIFSYIDLSAVGLENSVKIWDYGTHSDARIKNKIFSVAVVPKSCASPGAKKIKVDAADLYGGTAEGEIALVVE